VIVHLYDLSEAFAQLNAVSIDLMGYGGGLHTGVEVYGVEWSFGTSGVSCSLPKKNRNYVYRQMVNMGKTLLTSYEVEVAVRNMQYEWSGTEYDLFAKNCGTFCNALCTRLGVGSLPSWVTRLAEDGANSTTIRRIADMMARNGLIGEASPAESSKNGSHYSGSDVASPVRQLSSFNDEEWLCSSGRDSHRLGDSKPQLSALGHGAGKLRVHSNFAKIPSSVRGTSQLSERRSATFHGSHCSHTKTNTALRALTFDDGSMRSRSEVVERRRLCLHNWHPQQVGPRMSTGDFRVVERAAGGGA
jgi:hypothetical protein